MVEREYVTDSQSIEEKNLRVSRILNVLGALKKSSVCEIAKRMRVQVPGFRLNKAPKNRIIDGIISRLYSKPVGDVLELIINEIFKEYPTLLEALSESDKDFDLDHFVELCGVDIVAFVLDVSSSENHQKLLEVLMEQEKQKPSKEKVDAKKKKTPASEEGQNDEETARSLELKNLKEEIKQLRRLVAEKDRVISNQKKDLKKAERKLEEERSFSGKRSNEIGSLRKENNSLKKSVNKLDVEKGSLTNQIKDLKAEIKEHKKTIESLNKTLTDKDERTLQSEQRLERFLIEKRRLFLEALKWEAKWQIESLLRSKGSEEREVEMEVLIDPQDLQKAYLDAVRIAQNKLVDDFSSLKLDRRKETLDQIKTFINLEELVEKVPLKDEAFLPINIRIDPQKCTEQIVIEGMFIYEGPHGYLRTDDGLFIVTPYDVITNNLVTGDRLRITLERNFAEGIDIGLQIDVLEKTESKETICSLQKDGDEILVINPYNYRLELSQTEFESIGCNLEDPVTVIYPDIKMAKIPKDLTIYARVIKAHDPTWQEMPARERKRSEKKRASGSREESVLEPIYQDETVLVVGGETCKEQLKVIVESLSGEFIFQSGFDCKGMVESNVKKADLVICMTQELSHSIQKLVLKASDKYQTPYYYYNDRGTVRFRNFLIDLKMPH